MKAKQELEIVSNSLVGAEEEKELVVITVWYNRAEHVEHSIGSLLNQTVDNYTIFAVDDGSTDDTGDLLEEMLPKAEEHNVPMSVWKKRNEGFVISLKKAIEEKTKNEVIALHGAGDRSKRNRLQTQLNMLRKEESVVATGVGLEEINSQGKVLRERNSPKRPKSEPFNGLWPKLGTHGALMTYRDSYKKAGGYREHFKYAQDVDFFFRLRECGEFLNTDEILYSKLVSEKTVASRSNKEKVLEQIICSAAAFESARYRQCGKPDPINTIYSDDWEGMKSIAKQSGLDERTTKNIVKLLEECIKERELSVVSTTLQFAGIRGVFTILGYVPRYYTRI